MKQLKALQKMRRYEIGVYILVALAAPLFIAIIWHNIAGVKDRSINNTLAFILSVSVALPEIAIWTVATVGAVRFKRYASSIKQSKDGSGLNDIASALLLMVAYVILFTVAGSVADLFKNTSMLNLALFLSNHVPIVVALASAYMLLRGAQKLHGIVPLSINTNYLLWLSIASVIVFGSFAWDVYRVEPTLKPVHGVSRFAVDNPSVLLATYVVPYIVVWIMGLVSCITIANYATRVKGAIYKYLLSDLYKGILVVYACTFFAQLFIISRTTLDKFSVALVLIYVLLLIAAYGFHLIYRGATKLQKIEKV